MSMLSLIAMLAVATTAPAATAATPPAATQGACTIVYGDTWGFMVDVPPDWSSACGDRAMAQTALTMWPSDESPDALSALMYVSVSMPRGRSLDAFIQGDLARYTKGAVTPGSASPKQPAMQVGGIERISSGRRLVHIAHADGDRDELVAYIKGPTAYFILVLDTSSPAMTATYRPAFKAVLDSFDPLRVTIDRARKAPAHKH